MKNPDVTFRAMTPDDVPRLQALMRRCYGESYFDGIYYDADALRLLISEGKQYSAIALNESGEVVAHIGLRNPRRGRTADSTGVAPANRTPNFTPQARGETPWVTSC